MSDIFTVTVELLGEAYPSKNHEYKTQSVRGPKSKAYEHLKKAVQSAAEDFIERTGWATVEEECLVVIVLYVPHVAQRDACNIGTAECNALTSAGIWSDDTLANPCLKYVRIDAGGVPRVSVTVVRLFAPLHASLPPPKRPKKNSKPASGSQPSTRVVEVDGPEYDGQTIPPGFALVGTTLVRREEALRLFRESMKKR